MAKDDFSIAFDAKQMAAFMEVVNKLPSNVGRNAFRGAMRRSAAVVLAKTISVTPKKTGRLREALRVKSVKKYEPVFFKTVIFIRPGKDKDDPKGAYYGWMVHKGHLISEGARLDKKGKRRINRKRKLEAGAGRFVPPNPFMEKGADLAKGEVFSDFSSSLKKELQRQWNRIPKSKRTGALDMSGF